VAFETPQTTSPTLLGRLGGRERGRREGKRRKGRRERKEVEERREGDTEGGRGRRREAEEMEEEGGWCRGGRRRRKERGKSGAGKKNPKKKAYPFPRLTLVIVKYLETSSLEINLSGFAEFSNCTGSQKRANGRRIGRKRERSLTGKTERTGTKERITKDGTKERTNGWHDGTTDRRTLRNEGTKDDYG
jgi:hypothetical protein